MNESRLTRRARDERSLFRSLPLPLARRVSFFLTPLQVTHVDILVEVLKVYPLSFLSVIVSVPTTSRELGIYRSVVSDDASTVLDVLLPKPRGEYTRPLLNLFLNSKVVEAIKLRDAKASLQVVESLSKSAANTKNLCHLLHFTFTTETYSQKGSVGKMVQCLTDLIKKDKQLCCLDIKSFGAEIPTATLKECGLLEAVKASTSLCYLRLVGAGLRPDAGVLVAKALESNKCLQFLCLGSNPIGDEGLVALAQSLESNTTLEVLLLCMVGATGVGAQALARSLCRNSSLRQLLLKDDCLGVEGGRAFAAMLKVNKSLHFLCIDYCDLQEEGCRHLISAISVNRTLRVLRMNFNGINWKDQLELTRRAEEGGTLRVLEVADKNLLKKEPCKCLQHSGAQQLEPWNRSYARHMVSRSSAGNYL